MRVHAVQTGLLRSVDSDNLKYVVIAAGIVDADGNDRTTPDHVDAIDMILQKYVRCTSCYMKGRIVSVLASTQAGFNKYLHILVEEIVQSVERIMSMKCQIGVSRSMDFLTDCREGYLEAMNAMSYSYSQKGQSHVYFIADEEKNVYFSQENLQLVVEKIEALLRGGTDRELEEYLNELEREVRVGKNSLVLFSLLISMIVASVYKVLYTVAEESDIRRIQSEYPLHEMNEIERIAESFQNVKKMCMLTKAMIAEQRKKSSEVICEKAVQIIEKRYTEQELSVMQVSAEIGVSPNYLSALIKKNTGNTFIELLTKKRIDKARELLCCTSMKIREITEECGYRDQYYFSHCFKKVTGMTPNGCRREYGEQG